MTLSSVPAAMEQPTAGPPEAAVCAPSDAELAAVPRTMRAPTPTTRSSVPHRARKPNRALDEAIAAVAERTDDANATERSGVAPPVATDTASASEPISNDVTTTSAPLPAAAPALAPARLVFENRLPDSYQLERARVLVDRAVVYDGRTPGSVWISAGPHAVQVSASFRLNDPVFTYVRVYRIQVESVEHVPASAASLAVVATALPKGGVTTPVNERAGIVWRSFALK